MLQTFNLTKVYPGVTAVKDLSFTLERGDLFGFIGPNGAGKTTTIKMLATLLEPTSGTATIDGHDIGDDPDGVRAVIGYMPDYFGVYDDVKVWEYLDFFAAAYRIPKAQRPQLINDVLELTDLTIKRDTYVEALSRGMKQRLCLAKTLVHDPKLLLLDEPASGLDPRARIEIKELLKELRRLGKTILISSHILPELADMCNKIGIIEQGELIVWGPVDEIMRKVTPTRKLEITLADRAAEAAKALEGYDGVKDVRVTGNSISISLDGSDETQVNLLQHLVSKGFAVRSFAEEETDLEDIFMRVTRGAVQ